jgi:LmeA-like phospholipid-binding
MRRISLIAAIALAAVLALLVIAQLVLPGIAEQRLRDRLARSGKVLDVEVHAFPAIELLWHQADSVVVRMSSYRSSSATLNSNVGQVGDVGRLDASATELHAGLLTVHHATLRKRGNAITASADVTQSDLQTAFPVLDSVRPVSSSGGVLTLQGTATLLGVTSTIDATVRPYRGTLVVSPDVPFGGLATITLFSNPALEVQSVAADPAPGGFSVSVRARLP